MVNYITKSVKSDGYSCRLTLQEKAALRVQHTLTEGTATDDFSHLEDSLPKKIIGKRSRTIPEVSKYRPQACSIRSAPAR